MGERTQEPAKPANHSNLREGSGMTDSLFWQTIRLIAGFVVLGFYGLLAVGLLGYWIGGLA